MGFQEVILREDLQADETAHPVFPNISMLDDPFARRSMSELYLILRGATPGDWSAPDVPQRVLRALQDASASGRLVSVRRKAAQGNTGSNSGSGSGNPFASPPPRRRSSAPPPADDRPEKTWVEIQLLDPDGEPVGGAKYRLKITDGSVREGTLNDEGKARVNGIDPGSCTVWFPDFDAKEWRPAAG